MKKISIIFTLFPLFLMSCNSQVGGERDFNFIFKYGVGAVPNELNTFNDSFTKDMIVEDSITTTMILSEDELATVENKITEFNIFGETVVDDANFLTEPCGYYSLKVESVTLKNTIEWSCENMSENKSEFVDFMIRFIESRKEFQALPLAQGGYR